jgi:hypothetical protein
MDEITSSEADNLLVNQDMAPFLYKPNVRYLGSEEPATDPYRKPDESAHSQEKKFLTLR